MTSWQPRNYYLETISHVFDVGLPFALIGSNSTADAHRSAIGRAIVDGEELPPSDWSEVQVAALLTHMSGAITFVPRAKGRRTPDIRAEWAGGTLAVEVTRAEKRHLHAALVKNLTVLSEVIRPDEQRWHTLVFFQDATDQSALDAVLDAVIKLQPEQGAEEQGSWAVRSIPLDRREDVVGPNAVSLFAPAWWPDGPTFFVQRTVVGGAVSPIVNLRSKVPATSYLNPICRKANRPQRDKGKPYLIALDVSELPGAHDRVRVTLLECFREWRKVSGVMLFDYRPWIGTEKKEWVASLCPNGNADFLLPEPLINRMAVQPMRFQFQIS